MNPLLVPSGQHRGRSIPNQQEPTRLPPDRACVRWTSHVLNLIAAPNKEWDKDHDHQDRSSHAGKHNMPEEVPEGLPPKNQ